MPTAATEVLGAQRLIRLAAFLYTLSKEKFDFSEWVAVYKVDDERHLCGTVCCAAGWLPHVFPGYWELRIEEGTIAEPRLRKATNLDDYHSHSHTTHDLCDFFSISYAEVRDLFIMTPGTHGGSSSTVPPNLVADRLVAFAATRLVA